MHITEPRGALLSYAAPTDLCCTLMSYSAPCWATLHLLWATHP